MQMLFRMFLAVYLAHLLTDFVFQTTRLIDHKRGKQPRAFVLHAMIHYLSAVILIGFFIPGSFVSLRMHAVIAGLTLVHMLMDLAKISLVGKRLIADGSWTFVSDQFLHFLTVVFAVRLLSPVTPFRELIAALYGLRIVQNKFLVVPAVYVGVIFGGGYLIRFLTRSMAAGANSHSPGNPGEQLQNAGLYIGWLERFLVLTALLLQSPATVGLILTAKSIARYPEFKSETFAEYFLIGTLLSISLALVGGALLAKLLLGQIRLSG